MFENVLKKGKIGNVELKNRFVMPSMGTGHSGAGGAIGDEMIGYYAARAHGGFGLIITEFTGIDPNRLLSENQLRIYSDEFIPGFKRLADAVHAGGAKVFMQLHHGGRLADPRVTGHPVASSSTIASPVTIGLVHELKTWEVYDLIEKFGDGALRAKKAGYDGVELHGAHGYLIPQFMSAYANRRIDEFGGGITARARFPTGIIKNIKQKCGADFPVVMRLSGDEMVDGAMKLNETRVMAQLLEEAGADALHVSIGAYGGMYYALAPYCAPMGFNTYTAEEIKKSVKIPVLAVGRIHDPALADAVVRDGMADFITLGRASIADPCFPNKVFEGRIDEIVPCISCMTARCLAGPSPGGFRPGTSCAFNPFSGHETSMKIEPATKSKNIVIVGGGVAGLEAAWISAARGHKVVLYEKNEKPGGQALTAGMPPGKQGFSLAVKHYITMCKKHGVDIRLSTEANADMVTSLHPDAVILSTGAKPGALQVPNEGIAVVQATDVLDGKVVPGKNVLVVGCGYAGLSVTDYLLPQARSVTVAEMLDQPSVLLEVGPEGGDLTRDALYKAFREGGAKIMTNTKVERLTKDGAVCSTKEGEVHLSGYDMAILAVGSLPYNPLEKELEGKVPEIHVIGDAKEARLIPEAVLEGAELAIKI